MKRKRSIHIKSIRLFTFILIILIVLKRNLNHIRAYLRTYQDYIFWVVARFVPPPCYKRG